MTTRQYARLVSEWIASIGLDPLKFGTHSLRRTKATLIYQRTGNLRAVQLLLEQESTVRCDQNRERSQPSLCQEYIQSRHEFSRLHLDRHSAHSLPFSVAANVRSMFSTFKSSRRSSPANPRRLSAFRIVRASPPPSPACSAGVSQRHSSLHSAPSASATSFSLRMRLNQQLIPRLESRSMSSSPSKIRDTPRIQSVCAKFVNP
jgi:hypothetical protein